MQPVLCVGLVCLDQVTVVDKFPTEDTDQRSRDQYKVISWLGYMLCIEMSICRYGEEMPTTAVMFWPSWDSSPHSLALLQLGWRLTPLIG